MIFYGGCVSHGGSPRVSMVVSIQRHGLGNLHLDDRNLDAFMGINHDHGKAIGSTIPNFLRNGRYKPSKFGWFSIAYGCFTNIIGVHVDIVGLAIKIGRSFLV
jgi:hypothetical protein